MSSDENVSYSESHNDGSSNEYMKNADMILQSLLTNAKHSRENSPSPQHSETGSYNSDLQDPRENSYEAEYSDEQPYNLEEDLQEQSISDNNDHQVLEKNYDYSPSLSMEIPQSVTETPPKQQLLHLASSQEYPSDIDDLSDFDDTSQEEQANPAPDLPNTRKIAVLNGIPDDTTAEEKYINSEKEEDESNSTIHHNALSTSTPTPELHQLAVQIPTDTTEKIPSYYGSPIQTSEEEEEEEQDQLLQQQQKPEEEEQNGQIPQDMSIRSKDSAVLSYESNSELGDLVSFSPDPKPFDTFHSEKANVNDFSLSSPHTQSDISNNRSPRKLSDNTSSLGVKKEAAKLESLQQENFRLKLKITIIEAQLDSNSEAGVADLKKQLAESEATKLMLTKDNNKLRKMLKNFDNEERIDAIDSMKTRIAELEARNNVLKNEKENAVGDRNAALEVIDELKRKRETEKVCTLAIQF